MLRGTNVIRKSTIQDREKIRNAIDCTQEINALLRRSLSIMNNKNTDEEIAQKIIHFMCFPCTFSPFDSGKG